MNHGKVDVWFRRGDAGGQSWRHRCPGRAEPAHVMIDGAQIGIVDLAQPIPGHWCLGAHVAGQGDPLVLVDPVDQQAQVGRIGCSLFVGPSSPAPFQPLLLRHIPGLVHKALGVAVVAAGNLYQVAAAFDFRDCGGWCRWRRATGQQGDDQQGEDQGNHRAHGVSPQMSIGRTVPVVPCGCKGEVVDGRALLAVS